MQCVCVCVRSKDLLNVFETKTEPSGLFWMHHNGRETQHWSNNPVAMAKSAIQQCFEYIVWHNGRCPGPQGKHL